MNILTITQSLPIHDRASVTISLDISEMRETLEGIREAARDIQEINERCGFSREIGERSRRILELSDRLAD